MVDKWDIVRVYRPDLPRPHDKYCICISPTRQWYFYINSDAPQYRRAREVAIEVSNFEISCLTHTSYIDTTYVVTDLPEKQLSEAIRDPKRRHGSISPSLRRRIVATAAAHGVLSPEHAAALDE